MTPENALLVRQSWAAVEPRAGQFAAAFYQRLFELDPAVQRMFAGTDFPAQGAKFTATLSTIVAALDDPERLVPVLADLGRRHQGYGVRERQYELLGDVLLGTLQSALEPSWTTELHDAWSEAYTLIASIMKRAGNRASGSVPAANAPAPP
jgi:hemoglobin-like flavoprotein